MIQQQNQDLNFDKAQFHYIYLTYEKLKTFVQRVEIFCKYIAFNFTLASFLLCVIALPFFSCALLVTSCCCLNHLLLMMRLVMS